MWSERKKIISDFDEVISYIKQQDSFHDYRLGNVEFKNNSIVIMIEEDTKDKYNEQALVWDFSFDIISDLKFELDCFLPMYIYEVSIENHAVEFGLTNGYIMFDAEDISLGIPKVE